MLTIISTLTIIVSLTTKFIGYPDQIRLILKEKQTNNISLLLNLLGAISYGLFTLHGYLINDWVTVIAQIFGVVFSLILVFLTLKYRRTNNDEERRTNR